jgi:sugar phosphate isomerase/epimerase
MHKRIERPLLCGTTVCYPLSVSPLFTLSRALEGLSRVGLRYVEIAAIPDYCDHLPFDRVGDRELDNIRHLLESNRLTAIAVSASADLTTETGIASLDHAMSAARALDVHTIVTNIQQTETAEGATRFHMLLPNVLALAEKHDVVVALEVHGGLVCTGTQGAALVDGINSDRLKLTYDMANVVTYGGVLPEEDLRQMGKDVGRVVAHVHLKDRANLDRQDRTSVAFGTGVLDFESTLRLLHDGGYQGPMTLEVELDHKPKSPEVVDEALLRSYEYLETILAPEVARDA